LLILRQGAEVDRSWLAGTLWPDSSDPQAMANLRISLTDLRRALEPQSGRLRSPMPRTLSLDLSEAEVDVVAFDRDIASEDISRVERAVGLYRGPLLEGCAEEWVVQERSRREQAYLAALERLAAVAVERGEHGAAESYLRRAVAVDPARETAQRALMRTLAASGSYPAAMLVYRELRSRLHRELNTEPDAETRSLFEQLRQESREMAAPGEGEGRLSPRQDAPRLLPGARSTERGARSATTTHTFLFTDIEGSTRLWEENQERMREALARHDALLRSTIETHHGHVFKTMGDAFYAAFVTATDAVDAAIALQRALESRESAGPAALRIRIALHTGEAEVRDDDYFGPALNRVARLLSVAHGGQILLSGATRELVQDALPPQVTLRDLGRHPLRDLQRLERLFQLLHPDLPADFPPLPSLGALSNNLPQQVTSFVGREREIAAIRQLLAPGPGAERPVPLLTLTGAGGTGKTRLALQVAAELLEGPDAREGSERVVDGVWLVDLANLSDPALLPQAVASVLGIREGNGTPRAGLLGWVTGDPEEPHHVTGLLQTLVEALKPRRLLLLLDNCEHLLSACAELADLLLRRCPGVQILATSREALGIAGERTYRLPSLSSPERPELLTRPEDLASFEATRLFIERATASMPTFAVSASSAAVVAQICRRLDGIPLAIELAAARIKALPPEQILQRLDDRFRLLTSGSRTALPRQQTLRALIDWSYDLLSEAERALLRRLSVFAGGWSLEAAEAVCAGEGIEEWEVMDLLVSLAEKSLVQFEEREGAEGTEYPAERSEGRVRRALNGASVTDASGPPSAGRRAVPRSPRIEAQYWLLETVRQYSRERLLAGDGESAAVQDRHLAYFLSLAEQAAPELAGPDTVWWLDRLEEEHDNLRAALAWSVESGQVQAGLRLGAALQEFWWLRGYHAEGEYELGRLLVQECPEGELAARARVLCAAGRLSRAQRETVPAQRLFEEALAISRTLDDRAGIAQALVGLGGVAQQGEELETARACFEESLGIRREQGDSGGTAFCLHALGFVAMSQGDLAEARALHEESVAIWRESGDETGMVYGLDSLGCVTLYQGELETARSLFEQALGLARKLGDKAHIAYGIIHLGWVAQCLQGYAAAGELYEQGLAIWRELGLKDSLIHTLSYLGQVARRQGDVTAARERFTECLAICRALGNRRVTAWLLLQLADIAGTEGDGRRAIALATESVQLYRDLRDARGVACCLAALAEWIQADGDPERAARLLGAARALCDAAQTPMPPLYRIEVDCNVPPIDHASLERRVEAARAALDARVFAAAWAEGQAMSLEDAVAYALGSADGAKAMGRGP
jgi:predicted ATPase/class 3 adenylate cyclase/Tfp pilus assembly protein PilF